eukprot:gene13925-19855_t
MQADYNLLHAGCIPLACGMRGLLDWAQPFLSYGGLAHEILDLPLGLVVELNCRKFGAIPVYLLRSCWLAATLLSFLIYGVKRALLRSVLLQLSGFFAGHLFDALSRPPPDSRQPHPAPAVHQPPSEPVPEPSACSPDTFIEWDNVQVQAVTEDAMYSSNDSGSSVMSVIPGTRHVDEMDDAELLAMVEAYKKPAFLDLLPPLGVSEIFLRIPDADPSMVTEESKENLSRHIEGMLPGMSVIGMTFSRGSLLVGISVLCRNDLYKQRLKAVNSPTWLAWLGLPPMDLSVRMGVVKDDLSKCMDQMPLVTVIETGQGEGSRRVSLPLHCTEEPSAVFFRGSVAGIFVDVAVVPSADADVSSGASFATPFCLLVNLPQVSEGINQHSPLQVRTYRTSDGLAIATANVLAVEKSQEVIAAELCSMPVNLALQPPSTEPFVQREIVNMLCSFLEICSKPVDPTSAWESMTKLLGIQLLMRMVQAGALTSSRLVKDLLLSRFSALELESCWVSHTQDSRSQGSTLLHMAMHSRQYSMVEEVCKWGSDHGFFHQWDAVDCNGMTPLHVDVSLSCGRIARQCLDNNIRGAVLAWETAKGGHTFTPKEFAERLARIAAARPRGGYPLAQATYSPYTSAPWYRIPGVFAQDIVNAIVNGRVSPMVLPCIQTLSWLLRVIPGTPSAMGFRDLVLEFLLSLVFVAAAHFQDGVPVAGEIVVGIVCCLRHAVGSNRTIPTKLGVLAAYVVTVTGPMLTLLGLPIRLMSFSVTLVVASILSSHANMTMAHFLRGNLWMWRFLWLSMSLGLSALLASCRPGMFLPERVVREKKEGGTAASHKEAPSF